MFRTCQPLTRVPSSSHIRMNRQLPVIDRHHCDNYAPMTKHLSLITNYRSLFTSHLPLNAITLIITNHKSRGSRHKSKRFRNFGVIVPHSNNHQSLVANYDSGQQSIIEYYWSVITNQFSAINNPEHYWYRWSPFTDQYHFRMKNQ